MDPEWTLMIDPLSRNLIPSHGFNRVIAISFAIEQKVRPPWTSESLGAILRYLYPVDSSQLWSLTLP